MQLKTAVGLESRFMLISDALFRQRIWGAVCVKNEGNLIPSFLRYI